MHQTDLLREETDHIILNRVLGRSRTYVRLLEFLTECAAAGRVPKEVEIAQQVFDRDADFDPSQDSMVRVYVFNLRRKLEAYYGGPGRTRPYRICIARGEYRVTLEPLAAGTATPDGNDEVAVPTEQDEPEPLREARRPRLIPTAVRVAAAASVAALLGAIAGFHLAAPATNAIDEADRAIASSPVWASLLDDELPLLIAVGDYYIFAELGDNGAVTQLVREFDVNSPHDLSELKRFRPELRSRYIDLDLTYLPRGTASALADLLRVTQAAGKPARIVTTSQLNVAAVKSSHVIYVGYVSGMGALESFVLSSSALAVGATYDELIQTQTGDRFASEAGVYRDRRHYRDYGLLSTFPGPNGNQILVVAGLRDPGLMQLAQSITDPARLRAVEWDRPDEAGAAPAFEMLYQVTASGRAGLDAMLVHRAPLDYELIWGVPPH